jgi:hypothetical protein
MPLPPALPWLGETNGVFPDPPVPALKSDLPDPPPPEPPEAPTLADPGVVVVAPPPYPPPFDTITSNDEFEPLVLLAPPDPTVIA